MKALFLVVGLLLVGCGSSATASNSPNVASSSGGDGIPPAPLDESNRTEDGLPTVSVADLSGRLARRERVHVFDANSRGRYEQGHIPSARWVQATNLDATALPADRASLVVFYCGSEHCMASHEAARAAMRLGYTRVAVMPSGISGWESAGRPVVRGPDPS